ncbi:argininosuccinate lyase [Phnomibacter ginsenosidimutans]|uniref:Argininosuccinate lyase n=1 Tax=Phnomibacter ginsenosidimutans TaxID=2676868 RepID=A0A6I6GQG9_9BACT|nr:argininosuccinate lyase [Phnomibacter ginsenosidimutans]QGW29182.1 argininosuccinate lyase [Phnomibacter ginsenosidimutans]
MKLWSKDATATSQLVEQFTVGRDKEFDALMAPFDVQGSMAHVAMLTEQGLMTAEENELVQKELTNIHTEVLQQGFVLPADVEDIHSYVELLLTQRIGEAGKKIHTGRSRNDQVAVDIKLFLRATLQEVKQETETLFSLLITLSEQHKDKLIPGYTHLQIAMPSSAGMWLSAYAESLVDDMEMLAAAYAITNKNPLGSGAGYGSSFPLNRKSTTEKLQFATLNWNSVYAQMSRGKTEKAVATGISYIAATLSKLAYDCCLYINQNFGFIKFPDELTTGSSIMPHKKNPDVFELIRAKCNRIQSTPNELTLLINNLPSGYHRDMQLTKEILYPAISDLKACLQMTCLMLSHMEVKADILKDEKYKYLFTVEAMNDLVNKGVSYRDAYREVGNQVDAGTFSYDYKQLLHTHEGSISNLCLDDITAEMKKVLAKF